MTKLLLAALLMLTPIVHADDEVLGREPAQYRLSPEDQRILQKGEINDHRYIWGGVVGTVVGFGIGHAVQGRYGDIGWVFTAGEAAGYVAIMAGILSCFGDRLDGTDTCEPPKGLIVGGAIALIGFHIWEIIDVWVRPPQINARYRELRARQRSELTIVPTFADRSPGLGLVYTF